MDAIITALKLALLRNLLFLKALNSKLIINAKIWNQKKSYNIDSINIHILGFSEFQSKTEVAKYTLLTDIYS